MRTIRAKINQITPIICLFICFSLFIMGCSLQGGSSPPAGPAVPTNVTVLRSGADFLVRWSGVSGADAYQVYRRQGNGSFFLLAGAQVDSTEYTESDGSYPKDTTLQYAVKSISGVTYSKLSDPSNMVSAWVQNVEPSRLAYNDRIRLAWDVHPEGPDYYKVYRYVKSGPGTYDLDDTFTNITHNYYEDADAGLSPETPYFYRVTWVADIEGVDTEFGQDAPLQYGVFSDTKTDVNEPNDDYAEAMGLGKDVAANGVLYSYGDGGGGVASDTDWYKYTGEAGRSIAVIITHPFPTDFKNGDLFLQFYYDGAYYNPPNQVFIDEQGLLPLQDLKNLNTFYFDIPAAAGTVSLYFRIYSTIQSTRNVTGDYTIEMTY
jgi:hypothetical protein